MRKDQRSKGHINLAMMAVALQDHAVRDLQLHRLPLQDSVRRRHTSTQRDRTPQWRGEAAHQSGERTQRCRQAHSLEEEYVLGPGPPSLTLAQKLGLVDAPPTPLTTDEWHQVKSRSLLQGESSQPCAICREEFRLQPQVLLSCSHVFHRACLRALERFSSRKCCPMCRRKQYETRVIHDAARLYREKCAVRIQACWRGYVARKWYRHARKTVPPKDKLLRRKFFEEKLQEISDGFMRCCDNSVEEFLSALDLSVESSRLAFREFDRQHLSQMKEEDWAKIEQKASQREASDCPICLTQLHPGSVETSGRPSGGFQQALLLSCSHVFHVCCLQAFEEFCWEGRPVCPVCRSPYLKRAL
ncbi:RING finger protein 32 isoform X1 [Brienomyrus brachyistius]|uniref:RING finger protein 32 isoform X1 n=2 Tax=Brienomyrus brachyistius TaxID=42636 RepID=UPI0020B3CB58|nr:RING finger protein 32 isoform X1 [Brienomyrus brachyistius]